MNETAQTMGLKGFRRFLHTLFADAITTHEKSTIKGCDVLYIDLNALLYPIVRRSSHEIFLIRHALTVACFTLYFLIKLMR